MMAISGALQDRPLAGILKPGKRTSCQLDPCRSGYVLMLRPTAAFTWLCSPECRITHRTVISKKFTRGFMTPLSAVYSRYLGRMPHHAGPSIFFLISRGAV